MSGYGGRCVCVCLRRRLAGAVDGDAVDVDVVGAAASVRCRQLPWLTLGIDRWRVPLPLRLVLACLPACLAVCLTVCPKSPCLLCFCAGAGAAGGPASPRLADQWLLRRELRARGAFPSHACPSPECCTDFLPRGSRCRLPPPSWLPSARAYSPSNGSSSSRGQRSDKGKVECSAQAWPEQRPRVAASPAISHIHIAVRRSHKVLRSKAPTHPPGHPPGRRCEAAGRSGSCFGRELLGLNPD